MMKANELQETKTLVDIDDTYPEEIVVEGEGGFEYGLSREDERGLIGFIRNLTSPTRREVIEPEKTVFRQKIDAPAGEYTKEYTPAKYGEEEVDFDYAPAVRGTRAAFEYAKSLFGSQETRDEAIAALKQAPEVVEKSMKDQMTAALGMTQGAESMITREGEEITFDPLAVPATMVPGGIAARAAATEGSTVLGIFGGKKGRSFADREASFEKAVNDGLKDEADLPDAWKGDEYLSKMFLAQDIFEASGGAFRGEDGLLRYEIPTRNVKVKTEEEGGVFRNIDDENIVFDFEAFDKLQKRKVKEVRDNPENFLPEGRDINEREADGRLVYNDDDILEYQNPITLKDVLDFPELYSEYPSLANLKFEFGDLPEGASASYTPFSFTGPSIAINTQDTSKREIIKNILHETQHAVDHKEDRQYGASFVGYLPRNASAELDKVAMSARIATQTLEGLFPPEKFGNLYPDANNYKALKGLSHEDARTIDLVRKLNSPESIEDMRARNPNPESHAGRLIEAYDSMDDMQRIMFKLYDEKMGDKYKKLTEVYEEAERKYLSTPGEVDARNVEDRFDNPDQQVGGDSPVLPTIFKDTDDAGRTIHKDISLTGGEDVDNIAFKAASNITTKAPLRKLLDKLPQKEIDELPKQPDNNRIFGYHGTARERKPDEPFFDIGFARKDDQFLGEGFYFTLDPKVAEEYANLRAFRDFDVGPIQKGKDPVLTHRETGKKTTVANLQKGLDIEENPLTMGQSVSRFDLSNIEKPYVVRTEKQRKELKAKIPQLKEEGYDAVLFADFKDRSKQIMVFPEHINKIDTSSMAGRTKSASPLEIGTSPAAEGGKLLANYTAGTAKDLTQKAKSAKVGLNPELIGKKVDAGKQVAIRLNLNSSIPDAPKGLDKLQTVHDKRPTGTALSYLPFATVENVEFFVNQTGRRDITSKIKGLAVKEAKNKFPAMSVNGQFNPTRNVLEEMGDDVVEVGFNPANTHLFVDMATGQAVKSADVATVIGNRVYAKGVTYMKKADAPEPKAASDGTELGSEVRYKFKRGGLMARK